MIIREINDREAWCISQLHHSRMTGEIARVWGNDSFIFPEFAEELRTAALLHDIGWTSWELAPEIDSETGHPYDFLNMSKDVHLQIWDAGRVMSKGYGTLISLLIFRHNIGLASLKEDNDPMVADFFKYASEQEDAMFRALAYQYNTNLTDLKQRVQRLNRFLLFWDYLSLRMCMGKKRNPFGKPPSPLPIDFNLEPHPTEQETYILDPWPFGVSTFEWMVEAYIHPKGEPFNEVLPTVFIPLTLIPKATYETSIR